MVVGAASPQGDGKMTTSRKDKKAKAKKKGNTARAKGYAQCPQKPMDWNAFSKWLLKKGNPIRTKDNAQRPQKPMDQITFSRWLLKQKTRKELSRQPLPPPSPPKTLKPPKRIPKTTPKTSRKKQPPLCLYPRPKDAVATNLQTATLHTSPLDERKMYEVMNNAVAVPGIMLRQRFSGTAAFARMTDIPDPSPPAEKNVLARDLPPLTNLEAMFDDMVESLKRTIGEEELADAIKLKSRPLRVFTMCSGTEAPLLGLAELRDAFDRIGLSGLDFEHVASAEIEPLKQAYISRNFKPPVLFRDVTDFGNEDALPLTVYAAPQEPPGDVDVVIAGTSCVDFSSLNLSQPDFEAGSESWATMWGVMKYAEKHRPKMVLLENVKGAKWDGIKAMWKMVDYELDTINGDTKDFYIPHTRNRTFALAIDMQLADKLNMSVAQTLKIWKSTMSKLKRRASSPYSDFLYKSDDPQYQLLMNDFDRSIKPTKRKTAWLKSRKRHITVKAEFQLGHLRKVTHWRDNGSCQPLEYDRRFWLGNQVERIWDTIEINHLRSIISHELDTHFKHRQINISQNCDREKTTHQIIPCLTSAAMPYDTFRCGIITGFEALIFQGIPVHRMIFTKETSKQLQDLAGNAMSTTIISASIISAFLAVRKPHNEYKGNMFEAANSKPSTSPPMGSTKSEPAVERLEPQQVMDLWKSSDVEQRPIVNELNVEATVPVLKKLAVQTMQLCKCELSTGCSKDAFYVCQDCGHTVCEKCKSYPLHNFVRFAVPQGRQRAPQFIRKVEGELPKRLYFPGGEAAADNFISSDRVELKENYSAIVRKAFTETLCYIDIKRGREWKIQYRSDHARLEVVFAPHVKTPVEQDDEILTAASVDCTWSLFAVCESDEAANSPLRTIFERPLATMKPLSTLLDGTWVFWDPVPANVSITITGNGFLNTSYEAKLGIREERFVSRQEFTSLKISCSKLFEGSVANFKLLPNCCAAQASLHRSDITDEDGRPLFFFLDPDPIGPAKEDSYVLTGDPYRRDYPHHRSIVMRLKEGWRPNVNKGKIIEKAPECSLYKSFTIKDDLKLAVAPADPVNTVFLPITTLPPVPEIKGSCDKLLLLLGVRMSMPAKGHSLYKSGKSYRIDLFDRGGTLKNWHWILKDMPIPLLGKRPPPVKDLDISKIVDCHCQHTCSPAKPKVRWCWSYKVQRIKRDKKVRVIRPFEDQDDAGRYEIAIQERPQPLQATLHCSDSESYLDIRLNLSTLIHRALAALNTRDIAESAKATVTWKIERYDRHEEPPVFALPKDFKLKSNVDDGELQEDLPGFRRKLWEQQSRTVNWMRTRETETGIWKETAIVDNLIPALGWRVQVVAEADSNIKGGIIADVVGAGKTITALALVAANPPKQLFEYERDSVPKLRHGLIESNASLFVVPKHIISQWQKEQKECFGENNKKLITITAAKQLEGFHWTTFTEDVIILITMDVLKLPKYWDLLRDVSCALNVPRTTARALEQWTGEANQRLRAMLKAFKDAGHEGGFFTKRNEFANNMEDYDMFPAFKKRKDVRLFNQNNTDIARPTGSSEVQNGKTKSDGLGERKRMETLPGTTQNLDSPLDLLDDGYAVDLAKLKKITPVFHLFSFKRVVVDEFTYLDQSSYLALVAQSCEARWLLSATPPFHLSTSINTMAKLMGTSVSDDDVHAQYLDNNVKQSAVVVDKSYSEEFQDYQNIPSVERLKYQHLRARAFLACFVRQNNCILADVNLHETILVIQPSIVEYLTYLECYQAVATKAQSFGQKSTVRRRGFAYKSRQDAMEWVVCHSQNAVHALLRCIPEMEAHNRRPAILEKLCEELGREVKHLSGFLLTQFQEAFAYHEEKPDDEKISGTKSNAHLSTFLRGMFAGGNFGDNSITKTLDQICSLAYYLRKKPTDLEVYEAADLAAWNAGEPELLADVEEMDREDKTLFTRSPETKHRAFCLFRDVLALVATVRRERCFKLIRQLSEKALFLQCSACGQNVRNEHMKFMAICGHAFCNTCLQKRYEADHGNEQCLSIGCDCSCTAHELVPALAFTQAQTAKHTGAGSKVKAIVNHINEVINKPGDKSQYVLVFLQFDSMKRRLMAGLQKKGIRVQFATSTKPKPTEKAEKVLPIFTEAAKQVREYRETRDRKRQAELKKAWAYHPRYRFGRQPRVLILMVDTVDAAGLNLQFINTVIFAQPVVTSSQRAWVSTMTQAKGRAFRYGQKKDVNVFHYVTARTMEVNILEDRLGQAVVERVDESGRREWKAVPEEEVRQTDVRVSGPLMESNVMPMEPEDLDEEGEKAWLADASECDQ